ncbi:DUF6528 family protein [Winogradskyella schleiferi]|uniref:DUF6528 family protein n=1 Tax=Winogradskyella schleiferi TaxID=2686078 RepID=UPI0015C00499|nr:DUF6528 family protein [Winogradskyella schleiferi]
MSKVLYIVFLQLIVLSCKGQPDKLIACGSDKVIIISANKTNEDLESRMLWEWSPYDAKSLPEEYKKKYFIKIDECKPTKNGNQIMITASTGGVAIIDKPTKDVVFYSYLANAHSIEELPNDRIAVAGSNHEKGNCVAIFNRHTFGEEPITKSKLFAGHGLVWDKTKQLLFVLGGNELQTYKLIHWESKSPKIELQERWDLPDVGGHDLISYSSDELLITTNNNVWVFNKSNGGFKIFTQLGNQKFIKGLSVSKGENKRIAFVQGEEKWWSHNIYLTNPYLKITQPSINFYKVRWWNYD